MMLSDEKRRFQLPDPEPHPAERILDVVIEMLESGGYDAVQLREVARKARIGLGTIYKLFPTRDDLVVTAIEHWMDIHTYAELGQPVPGETLYDGLMRVFRDVFEPWERSPRMLKAFHRARSGPGGERLQLQGANAIVPVMRAVLEGGDPVYVEDLGAILTSVAHGLIARFAAGEVDIAEILPTLERAVFRITTNNEPAARATSSSRSTR
jgi:TetR/AcrR family transcriptional regulator, cholesterol catabolism regulator